MPTVHMQKNKSDSLLNKTMAAPPDMDGRNIETHLYHTQPVPCYMNVCHQNTKHCPYGTHSRLVEAGGLHHELRALRKT
jgi:hypothetical protein